MMKIGVIADDFTGASDIALTLAEAGMVTSQYIGIPKAPAHPEIQAGVVALKSRTSPAGEAVDASLAACEWLLAQGAEQVIFKVCSTFDSTPSGNIGPVLDALADRLKAGPVIVCPAFPENGRSVYQGHLFVADRLLNESGMQDHPLTPMTDADLRRVLATQTERPVAHVPFGIVAQGTSAVQAALSAAYIIVDAIRDADLFTIAKASTDLKLLCGGSGIALGLPANFGIVPKAPTWRGETGKGVVLSGSCSRATREQVARYKADHPSLEISAQETIDGKIDPEETAAWALAQTTPPLIYSSANPDIIRSVQAKFGKEESADAVEGFFSTLARTLASKGAKRIVVAGGETSGAVVSGLNADVLEIGPRLAAGVPALRVGGATGLCLALKSGNFGGPNFFSEAFALMAEDHN